MGFKTQMWVLLKTHIWVLKPHAGSHIYCLSTHIYCFSAHIYILKFMSIFWKLYKTHICVSKHTFVFQNPHLCFEIHIYTSWIRVLVPVWKAKIWFCRNVNVGFKTQMWVLKPTFTFQNPDWKTDPTDEVKTTRFRWGRGM